MRRLRRTGSLLRPLLKDGTTVMFTLTLLVTNVSSAVADKVTTNSVFTNVFNRSCRVGSDRSRMKILLSLKVTLLLVFFVNSPFGKLVVSRVVLDVRLPFAIFLRIKLASSQGIVKSCIGDH